MILLIDGLPPSTNKAYETFTQMIGKKRISRRRLSSDGVAFKRKISMCVAEMAGDPGMKEIFQQISEQVPLEMRVVLGFPRLTNKGWGGKEVKDRYKKVDASNRFKILEDSIFEALGIDDSRVFRITIEKKETGKEEVMVWITPMT